MISSLIAQTSAVEVIKARISVRKYSERSIDKQTRETIEMIISRNNVGPFGNQSSYWLIETSDFADKPVKLGTYGFIRGAKHYLVGAVDNRRQYCLEDYAYCKQMKILELTGLGLGTCWIGGTFRRNEYAKTVTLSNHEIIPTITPVGYAADKNSTLDHLIKSIAGSRKRRSFEELFFKASFNTPLAFKDNDKLSNALEMVRLAPSANNAQPWRIIVDGNNIHFYLQRSKAFSALKSVDLQRIDMGIAMCHLELALNEMRIAGVWGKCKEHNFTGAKHEYICSYFLK